MHVTVEVPTGSTLEASSALGDIRVDGELGECRVKSGMGNIRLDHTGRLTLKTGFGNVAVDHVDGDADITTGSGEVRIGTVDGAAVVKNSNGATAIDEVTGDLRVKAANGGITIDGRGAVGRRQDRRRLDRRSASSAEASPCSRPSAGDLSWRHRRRAPPRTSTSDPSTGGSTAHSTRSDGPAPTDEVVEVRAHTTVGDISLPDRATAPRPTARDAAPATTP